MNTTTKSLETRFPVIDRRVPAHLETATFALG